MRMQVPLAKPQPWVLPVTMVCLALGILIALMLKPDPNTGTSNVNLRAGEEARQYQSKYEQVQKEVTKLRAQLIEVNDATANEQKLKKTLMQELNDLRIRGGLSPIEGPGIIITLDDSNALKSNPSDVNANALLVHDVDLMMLVNELRAAGAEAMSINDQRIVGSTAIRCVGPAIRVNDRAISAPFIIKAIGRSDTLYGAVNLPLGVLDQMRTLGSIHIDVTKKDQLRVPAVVVLPPLEVGKVVKDEKAAENGGQ